MQKKLLRIKPAEVAPEAMPIAQERILSGAPKEVLENLFTNDKENFFCGVWSSDTGRWTLNYTEDEFCYMIRGKAIITNSEGGAEEVNAGDAFVIPAGFQGSWETVGEAQKFYAIYEEA
ncbi:cupin domain-containing protein [Neptuniibacter halophilus]|uniref:cupin domain-containing protein n=1 Tax=Neptuniibacter halophilus TaxID=651666 RepID=UPI0025741B66|nr:cupin domain-containing protein [Neptuniibacter halophilus]